MSESIQIRTIGNSYGIILGRALLQELEVGEGDSLFVIRTPDGIRLTSKDCWTARSGGPGTSMPCFAA